MRVDQPAASALEVMSALVGDEIARVVYREIKYDDGKPWYLTPDHHSLDYGPELHLKSGRVVSFIWKWPVSYYLCVLTTDLSPELSGEHAIWDASNDSPWPSLLGRRIRATHLEWFQDEEMDGDFPLTVKILVEPESTLYITLGLGDEAEDHIAVLFSDECARQCGRFIATSGVRRPTSR